MSTSPVRISPGSGQKITAGNLTVNAAFLHEIKVDNIALREVLARSAQMLQQPRPGELSRRQLSELLASLRDNLATHFALEEAYGYFEDAVLVAPRLARRATQLREQHASLFLAVCQIVEDAERWQYGEAPSSVVNRIAVRFFAFHDQLQRHEADENELILQAADDDIGVGD